MDRERDRRDADVPLTVSAPTDHVPMGGPRLRGAAAGLDLERAAAEAGYRLIAGVDEAGRGAWAGPVVAAAVILAPDPERVPETLRVARDSKLLTPEQRAALHAVIRREALAVGVGVVPVEVIDRAGIGAANRLAMRRAVETLVPAPELVLVDWERIHDLAIPQRPIVDGDAICLSIAAASIVAKVTRDRLLVALDARFPGYGFAAHKGYGTPAHRRALAALGPCAAHRCSYAPVAQLRLQLGVDSADGQGAARLGPPPGPVAGRLAARRNSSSKRNREGQPSPAPRSDRPEGGPGAALEDRGCEP